MRWVAIPNKHDGKSYRRVTRGEDGAALYGAWCLIVQVASKCPVRGFLADHDGPLDAIDLSDKTCIPESIFQRALEILTSPAIGWLSRSEDPAELASLMEKIRGAGDKRARKPPADSRSSAEISRTAPASSSGNPADSRESSGLPAETSPFPASSDHPADSPGIPAIASGTYDPHAHALANITGQDRTGHHTPPGSERVRASRADLEATEHFLTSLFSSEKKARRLSSSGQHWLSHWAESLPLSVGQRAMLEWFYRLPADPSDFALKIRKTTAEKLAEELFAEIDRAEAYAEKTPGGSAHTGTRPPAHPEPAGWREKFAKKYPRAACPPAWSDVDERQQEEICAA
jgi:hypothetical protein